MSSSGELDPALLRPRLRTVFVEFTSRCNARCIYCPVSLPAYLGEDLELRAEDLARALRPYHLGEVQISGHGETTLLHGWVAQARHLQERGLPVTLTTNFAKKFTDEEIDVLSRMTSLKISVDTADGELLAKLRRGVQLERVEDSIRRILAKCRDDFRVPPFLHISCTVSDVVIAGLPDLVRWCKAQGADALGLVNLVVHEAPEGTLPIRHPAQGDARAGLESIARARALADELGVRLTVIPGLLDALEQACR